MKINRSWQPQIDTVNALLYLSNTVKLSPPFTIDSYISSSNAISASAGFKYSGPIAVTAGSTLIVRTRGYLTNLAIIATCNSSGGSIQSVAPSIDSLSHVYQYTFASDGYAIVSGRVADLDIYLASGLNGDVKFINMFHKMGVIGDSLASGELAYTDGGGDHYVDRTGFSWLSNLAKSCGATTVHYSQGGMTAKAWMTDSGGFKTALLGESTLCNAYFIALGTNDKSQAYPIGVISDVAGTDSFVGYMRQIIELITTHNPNAVIFPVSLYGTGTTPTAYSNMIRSIASLYSNCFYVDFIGNSTITTATGGNYTNLSHFTTQGYVIVAKIIENIVNTIVANNMSYFKFFGLNN